MAKIYFRYLGHLSKIYIVNILFTNGKQNTNNQKRKKNEIQVKKLVQSHPYSGTFEIQTQVSLVPKHLTIFNASCYLMV